MQRLVDALGADLSAAHAGRVLNAQLCVEDHNSVVAKAIAAGDTAVAAQKQGALEQAMRAGGCMRGEV